MPPEIKYDWRTVAERNENSSNCVQYTLDKWNSQGGKKSVSLSESFTYANIVVVEFWPGKGKETKYL